MSPGWKIADDAQKAFPTYDGSLLARKDRLAAETKLGPAIAEQSGKFNLETMRKLNAQVDLEHRPVATVAADFLAQAGLR